MNLMKDYTKYHKKGSTLIYVILLLCLITILGGGALMLANSNLNNTTYEIKTEQAFLTAKSSLYYTIDIFEDNKNMKETLEVAKRLVPEVSIVTSESMSSLDQQLESFSIPLSCATDDSGNKMMAGSS